MPERIGLYGGTFNPIHCGHINLAVEMLEKHSLDKIYFSPAALSPFKKDCEPIASHHRLAMLKLAIEDISEFSIIENELQRPPPSFTIDTIEELLAADNNKPADEQPQYFLILGEDALDGLHKWHRVEDIIAKVQLLIGARSCKEYLKCENLELQKAIENGMTITRLFDISSSEIRQRIQQKRICNHLLPRKVLDYIYRNRLYFNSKRPLA